LLQGVDWGASVSASTGALHLPEFDAIPVYDQGSEGACTGHATREVAGHALMRKSGLWVALSAQFSYNMTRMEEGTPLAEDSGCAIFDAVHGFELRGLCREEVFPTDPANLAVEPPQDALDDAKNHLGLLSFHVPDLATALACLAPPQGFAVSVGISVPDNMMSSYAAQTGEVAYPEPREKILGGHNIVLIGWDPDMSIAGKKGCFRFRNSWGDGWGAGGDGWLPAAYLVDGYASDGETVRSVSG
jgi:hypothetical protein